MNDNNLAGRRILIVEDEMLIAMALENLLRRNGCEVIGPARSVDRALTLLEGEFLDAAVIDINLDGERCTPVADALLARGVPFVVATGYSEIVLEEPVLQGAPRVNKPVSQKRLIKLLDGLLQ
jgi:two-component SAPR family response regulator